MASITKSGPLEIWLDRIGDYNPQLMRELRGKLKPLPILATLGVVTGFHVFLAFLYISLFESQSSNILGILLGLFRVLSPITIAIASHQLIDNLSAEVQSGTLNPLRLSPQESSQILGGKLLGVPALVYLFNLLCLPIYGIVSLAAGLPPSTIAAMITGDVVQMVCWLSASLYIALNFGKNKSVSTSIGTLLVGVGLLLQNTQISWMPWVMGLAFSGVWIYLFWQSANQHFRRKQSSQLSPQLSIQPQAQPQPNQTKPLTKLDSESLRISTVKRQRSIEFLEPVLDRIGEINPQLMRELRGKLTARNVMLTVIASIGIQLLSLANHPDERIMFLLRLQQTTIVIGCYQLIRNWTIEEEQGTFNPLRLSPQSVWSILWGKFLGVPSLVYLFNVSCLPLYLLTSGMGQISIAISLSLLLLSLVQTGFWFSVSLFFASLTAKVQGSKAISGAVLVGFCLLIQSYWNHAWLIRDNLDVYIFSIASLGGTSYLCWQAIGRRFRRPSATLGSKGQTYAVTAIVTALGLTLGGLDFVPILGYLVLAQGLVLIQPRQILLDWASQPAACLSWSLPAAAPAQATSRRAKRQDLIWGESSLPLEAIAIHVAIVGAGLGIFGLFHLDSIAQILAKNASTLGGLLFQTNALLLILGFIQVVRLRFKGSGPALTTLILLCSLVIPPLLLLMLGSDSSHPLWLLTMSPRLALVPSNLGPAIALLCLQWTGMALGYRQLNRDLRRLSQREFSRALTPSPSSSLQES